MRKSIAVLLTLVMTIGLIPVGVFANTANTADDFIPITNAVELNAIRDNMDGNFRLIADIDMAGVGWEPIGSRAAPFRGIFDGNGHTISNLYINMPVRDYVGLFGFSAGLIRNINMHGTNATGQNNVGSLVGFSSGDIEDVSITGARIRAINNAGGLVGASNGGIINNAAVSNSPSITSLGGTAGGLAGQKLRGTISNSYTVNIDEVRTLNVGGHVGGIAGLTSQSVIEHSFSSDIANLGRGNTEVGGLVGFHNFSTIRLSYTTNDVAGVENTGGLVGNMRFSTIEQSFATGNVESPTGNAGGLVGLITENGNIRNSFSTGTVALTPNSAGFVGHINAAGIRIENSYSLSNNPNGFATGGTITNSFFELDRINNPSVETANSPQARTAAQMKQQANFTGWDFNNVWIMDAGGYPVLRGLPNPFEGGGTEPGDGPSIVVLTEFPTGEVDVSWIDIEYIATPSPGAVITEVFYTINDGPPSYIYISEASNHTARGELGAARVFVLPQPENRFVFTVRDTAGGEASFEVANRPSFSTMGGWILEPIIDPAMQAFEYLPPPQWLIDYYAEYGIVHDGQPFRVMFTRNRLLLHTIRPHPTPDVVATAVATIDGVIIGQFPMTGFYTIEIPPRDTIDELEQLGEYLIAAFPELFLMTSLSISYAGEGNGQDIISIEHTNDPWWREWVGSAPFRRRLQWGLDAIYVPAVWRSFGRNHVGCNCQTPRLPVNVRVGVVDKGGVRHTHEDLNIPERNVVNYGLWPSHRTTVISDEPILLYYGTPNQSHGTMVMGVIAAEHCNSVGLAGVINIDRNLLFAYDAFRVNPQADFPQPQDIINSLIWSVLNGVQVINYSINMGVSANPGAAAISQQMAELLDFNYDFIVVQSGGNNRSVSRPSRVFSHQQGITTEMEARLKSRTITVGAINRDRRIWNVTNSLGNNWGPFLDLVAPGDEIYTTTSFKRETRSTGTTGDYYYITDSGTSLATPHVTGVAAMVWSANPGLDGAQLKDVLVQSAREHAREHGTGIEDRRGGLIPRSTYYLVNAYAAMNMALGYQNPAHTSGQIVGRVTTARAECPVENCRIENCFGACIGIHFGEGIPLTAVHLMRRHHLVDDDFLRPELGDDVPLEYVRRGGITDRYGHFDIPDITPGRYYLKVAPYGYVAQISGPYFVTLGVTTSLIEVVPDGSGRYAGPTLYRVRDEGEGFGETMHPLSPFDIPIAPFTPTGGIITDPVRLEFRRGLNVNNLSGEVVKTDYSVNGRFDVTLPAGFYTVTASADGFITTTRIVIIFGGIALTNREIVLYREPATGPRDITSYFTDPLFLEYILWLLDKSEGDRIFDYEVAGIRELIMFNPELIEPMITGIEDYIAYLFRSPDFDIEALHALNYDPGINSLWYDFNDYFGTSDMYANTLENRFAFEREEIPTVNTEISPNSAWWLYVNPHFESIAGIEHFTALERLSFAGGRGHMDFSNSRNLQSLEMFRAPQVTGIDISDNARLHTLTIGRADGLSSIDLSGNPLLRTVNITSSHIGGIETLDLTNNERLQTLFVYGGNLRHIDVSNNPNLEILFIGWINRLTSLDVTNNPNLQTLNVSGSSISNLNLRENINLEWLMIDRVDRLTAIDLSNNSALRSLRLSGGLFSRVDLSNNPLLENLTMISTQVTNLDLSSNEELRTVYVLDNLRNVSLSNHPQLVRLNLRNSSIGSTGITSLDLSGSPNLVNLSVGSHSLSSIDLSHNTQLEWVSLASNNLTSLDLSSHMHLRNLWISNNRITDLYMPSSAPFLNDINANNNRLSSINLSGFPDLQYLSLNDNLLTALDISNNRALIHVQLSNNQLTELNITNNPNIILLHVNLNRMPSPDAVIGWREQGLILDNRFLPRLGFTPQLR